MSPKRRPRRKRRRSNCEARGRGAFALYLSPCADCDDRLYGFYTYRSDSRVALYLLPHEHEREPRAVDAHERVCCVTKILRRFLCHCARKVIPCIVSKVTRYTSPVTSEPEIIINKEHHVAPRAGYLSLTVTVYSRQRPALKRLWRPSVCGGLLAPLRGDGGGDGTRRVGGA